MARVVFYPGCREVSVPEGTSVLEAARLAGLAVDSPCSGMGTCGKCKVRLLGVSARNVIRKENSHITPEEKSRGIELACQTKIAGDIDVALSFKEENKTLKILNHGQSLALERDSFFTKKFCGEENITRVFAGGKVAGSEAGNTEQDIYGLVVDIGTTTLVVSLVDLRRGTEIDSTSALNPQALHAQDVLSRIKTASAEDGLDLLHSVLIAEINRMIAEVTGRSGVRPENIYEAIFSGNTCMLHLAVHADPAGLGKYPYTPAISGGTQLRAADYGLTIAGCGLLYLPPVISAYVGADITSGLLAAKLYENKGVTLFIDIGTNGEMVLGFGGRLTATSTAAGPAFEGMNITCGMRAAHGAIEYFGIGTDGDLMVKTIGGEKAIGICGSGLLDIVSELVDYGLIQKNGKFADPQTAANLPALRERLVAEEGRISFQVAGGVRVTQKDIRQVQLAKGAVRAGIEFLLASKQINAGDVDRVLIAGAFGYHLRAKSLINIGLLPAEFAGKIDFIGNTSQAGGQAFLLNKTYRGVMQEVVESVEVLELANYKDFNRVFVKSMGF